LEALDFEFLALAFGDAFAGVVDLGFPFFDGFLGAIELEFDGLFGVGELIAALLAEEFDEFFALGDLFIQLDDLGVFGAEVFTQASADDFDFLEFLLGEEEFGGGGGGGRSRTGGGGGAGGPVRSVRRLASGATPGKAEKLKS
jgi:hypothetical protein